MSTPPDAFEDSIIGDVRRAWAKVLAECGNDLGKASRQADRRATQASRAGRQSAAAQVRHAG